MTEPDGWNFRQRPDQLRRPRLLALPAPLLCEIHGLFRRDAGPACGRHRLYGLGIQQLPSPLSPKLLEAVKRGVLAAGALPVEFPTISLGEVFRAHQPPEYRNLMSMDTEEMIRARSRSAHGRAHGRLRQGAVPARGMMRAVSGRPPRRHAGGGTDDDRPPSRRAASAPARTAPATFGRATAPARSHAERDRLEAEGPTLPVTAGTCAVMGAAPSTMACVAETSPRQPVLPGTAAIPAVHADRLRAAEGDAGAAAVALIGSGPHAAIG